MIDSKLIKKIRRYRLPISQRLSVLDRVAPTIKYIDQNTNRDSLVHISYKKYKFLVKASENALIISAFLPFLPFLITGLFQACINDKNSGLFFYSTTGASAFLWVAFVLSGIYYFYIRIRYANLINTYLNYLDYKHMGRREGINKFDCYVASQLGFGPKINKLWGIKFRLSKYRIIKALIKELPIEQYGKNKKSTIYYEYRIRLFTNKCIYVLYLYLMIRFLMNPNSGQETSQYVSLFYALAHNWWVLIIALVVFAFQVWNTYMLEECVEQIQSTFQGYIQNHNKEVKAIIKKAEGIEKANTRINKHKR